MIEVWSNQVIKNRVFILIFTVLLVIASIFSISKNPIGVNNSNEMWFLEGDPTLLAHDKMLNLFSYEKFGKLEVTRVSQSLS